MKKTLFVAVLVAAGTAAAIGAPPYARRAPAGLGKGVVHRSARRVDGSSVEGAEPAEAHEHDTCAVEAVNRQVTRTVAPLYVAVRLDLASPRGPDDSAAIALPPLTALQVAPKVSPPCA